MQHYISRNLDIPMNHNSQEVNIRTEPANSPVGGLFGGESLQIQIEHMN